ncbi:hypothetical protein V9K90_08590 [Pseudomonas sp. CCNWLW56]|uniref:hypothetical protein n=1 Tax=unclassified Pseudomonas TaxID=196821 RepID=UPI0030784469
MIDQNVAANSDSAVNAGDFFSLNKLVPFVGYSVTMFQNMVLARYHFRLPHSQLSGRGNHNEREFTMQIEPSRRYSASWLVHAFWLPDLPWYIHDTEEWRYTASHNGPQFIAYVRAAAGRNPQAERLRGNWVFKEIGIWFVRFFSQKRLGLFTRSSRRHRCALLREISNHCWAALERIGASNS